MMVEGIALAAGMLSGSSPGASAIPRGTDDRLRRRQHPPEHVRQQPAVPVVLDVVGRIDARDNLEGPRLPVLAPRVHGQPLTRRETGSDALDVVRLSPREPER